MYRGKVCGLYALSFLVLSIGSSVLLSTPSSASSAYDNAYQLTNTADVYLQKGWHPSFPNLEGQSVDLSNQWAAYIVNDVNWHPGQDYSTAKTSFETALDTGSWAVSTDRTEWASGKYIQMLRIYWVESGDFNFTWYPSALTASHVRSISVTYDYDGNGVCYPNSSDCRPYLMEYQTDIQGFFSHANGRYKNFLLYQRSGTVTYPDGYDGEKVRDHYEGKSENKLRFGWSVDQDGNVSAVDNQNVHADVLTKCGVTWTLYNSTSDYEKGSVINTVTQPQTKPYDYRSITQGFYILEEKPNYCIPFIDDGKIQPGTQNIEFKGLNIGGMSGINKQSSTILGEDNPLSQFGLTQAITAPLTAIQKLATVSCSPITIPMFNGTTATAQCPSQYYQSRLNAFYVFWQIAITGIVAYAVSIGIIRHTKRLLNPDDDRIEVVDL